MKRIIMIGMVATILLSACSRSAAPPVVKSSFGKQFPGVSPKWEKEDGNYEAVFTWNNHEMSVVFAPNGTWIESEAGIPVTELPEKAKNHISVNYPGDIIKDAAVITGSNKIIQYEAAIKGKDIIFDMDGNFIKELIE